MKCEIVGERTVTLNGGSSYRVVSYRYEGKLTEGMLADGYGAEDQHDPECGYAKEGWPVLGIMCCHCVFRRCPRSKSIEGAYDLIAEREVIRETFTDMTPERLEAIRNRLLSGNAY